ncbi:hypothetical protein SOM15_05400 [Rathayibacter festucae]|nr:hypothetical protein [Rathayibacter festucae]MDY0912254.1 hypothetical protein [Rathayibacter festucae]
MEHAPGDVDVGRIEPYGGVPRPGRGAGCRGGEHGLALRRQGDELSAPVVRIGPEGHEAVAFEVVHDPLNVLPGNVEVTGEPGDRSWSASGKGSEDLPARRGQPEIRDEAVSGCGEDVAEVEDAEHQILCRRPLLGWVVFRRSG